MGQLEKYGLYVLCLVIFLILGVTIWGEPDGVRPDVVNPAAAMSAPGGSPNKPSAGDVQGGAQRNGAGVVEAAFGGGKSLDSLLQPAEGFDRPKNATAKVPDVSGDGAGSPGSNGGGQPVSTKQVPKPEPKEPPAVAASRDYKIKKGDTLEGIAIRELGSRSRLAEIQQLNPRVEAKSLQVGQTIKLPGSQQAAAAAKSGQDAPPVTGGEVLQRAGAYRNYKIAKGDTLEGIAIHELGSRSRLAEIQQLNPRVEAKSLQIGQTIKLPIR